MAEALAPFIWGQGGSKDSVGRRRQLAEALMKSGMDYSPVQHWTQGAARLAQALVGGWEAGQADKQEKANNESFANSLASALAGSGGSPAAASAPASSGSPAAPSMAGGAAGARAMAMPNITPEIKDGIVQTASALGISPVDLATTISYETGGTFDPTKAGPTTKWGQHRGLIQFGEPQAKQYGVDWSNPVGSQLGANGAVAAYLRDRGVKPGMGLMDIYSTINAGAPGLYDRSDTAAGGAPGTVADKVNNQMAGHRAKAQALFADLPAAGASPVAMETGQPGFAVPGGAPAMSGATFNAIQEGRPLDPVFQTEGVSQPWMGTALQPAAPQVAQVPLPPPRPADLAMPQADMPALGAVPAMGQMPAPAVDWSQVDPNSPDGGVGAFQRLATAAGPSGQPSAPFSGIAQALSGASVAPSAPTVAQNAAPSPVAPAAAAPANPMAALAIALARSGDRDGAVKMASSLLQPVNGVQMGERLVDPRSGRVIADFTGANGGRSSEFGLQPVYGVGPDGKPVIMQIGKRGDAVATKLPEGVSLARDPIRVDGPTGTTLLDPQTRQQVGFIPKDIAGAKVEEAKGTAQGAAVTGLTDALAKSQQTLDAISGIRSHPGREAWGAQGKTAALPIIGNGLPGTEGRDFVTRVDQLKGQSFLEAFNMLKGGGAISENEGKTATAAIARLDRTQSKEGFDAALNDLEKVIRSGMERARAKATPGGATALPPQTQNEGGWQDIGGVRIRRKQ